MTKEGVESASPSNAFWDRLILAARNNKSIILLSVVPTLLLLADGLVRYGFKRGGLVVKAHILDASTDLTLLSFGLFLQSFLESMNIDESPSDPDILMRAVVLMVIAILWLGCLLIPPELFAVAMALGIVSLLFATFIHLKLKGAPR